MAWFHIRISRVGAQRTGGNGKILQDLAAVVPAQAVELRGETREAGLVIFESQLDKLDVVLRLRSRIRALKPKWRRTISRAIAGPRRPDRFTSSWSRRRPQWVGGVVQVSGSWS